MPRTRNGGLYIPPGGVIGAGQQTQAGQASLMGGGAPVSRTVGGATSSRRRKRRAKRVSSRRSRSSRSSRPARLVKGSRAAKAYMAKIRRKRRK